MAPPAVASTSTSVRCCRTTRPRPAPSAMRTATSRRRSDARATSRFDTLTHAMSSTPMPGAEHRVEQRVDLRAENRLRVGHHVGADAAVGRREIRVSSCAAIVRACALACATLTPGFSRAITG